jgi:hypothetical protein
LTGLPPTPAEIAAFLADKSSDAYEKVVDRLLASPHYGERMAQIWLDAARYADTSGYQADWERHMWPWRDWVIRAYNSNMPYDQFIIEQLAGDMLPHPTLDQRLATGFNRNHRINDEGGIIPAEYAVEYVIDRVDTTATVFLGLTVQCARCHDHKFDPISQKDFYRLYAYFDNVPEKGQDGRLGYATPFMRVPPPESAGEIEKLDREAADVQRQVEEETPQSMARRQAWERQTAADLASLKEPRWTTAKVISASAAGAALHRQPDESVLVLDVIQEKLNYDITIANNLERATGLRLEVLPDPNSADQRLGRGDGNILLNEIEVRTAGVGKAKGKLIKLCSAAADYSQEGHPISAAIDGKPDTGWAVDGDILHGQRVAIFTFDTPVVGKGTKLSVSLKQNSKIPQQIMNRVRLSLTGEAEPKLGPLDVLPDPVAAALNAQVAARTPEQEDQLAAYFRWVDPERQALHKQLASLRRKALNLASQGTPVMVMQELPRHRDTYLLRRGQYDQPDKSEKLTPGIPAALIDKTKPAPPSANRLDLARWIASPENPLTARVEVNRLWQMYFGVGIVKTAEDFGSQGEWPSHPELLDWLATEFVRTGWNVKAMQTLIVTSATYRQSSKVSPELEEKDPENRLLARGPRFRLDAFAIRDNALAIGGLLVDKVGGPPVKPYQPPGLWEELAFSGKTSVDKYVQGTGADLYRRSLYSFWKRTVPPPALSIFDAAGREMCSVRSARTNTPLQALNVLNDVVYVEAARAMAQRMLHEGGATPAERLDYGWELATGRHPVERERHAIVRDFDRYLQKYRADPAAAKALLTVGESPRDTKLDPSEFAAYTVVANVMLNLDETITKQ